VHEDFRAQAQAESWAKTKPWRLQNRTEARPAAEEKSKPDTKNGPRKTRSDGERTGETKTGALARERKIPSSEPRPGRVGFPDLVETHVKNKIFGAAKIYSQKNRNHGKQNPMRNKA
jgi:hypothetical protein